MLFSVFEDVGIKADVVDIPRLEEVSGGYDYVVIAAVWLTDTKVFSVFPSIFRPLMMKLLPSLKL